MNQKPKEPNMNKTDTIALLRGESKPKMNVAELRERQSWSLDQKIDHSLGTVESIVNAWAIERFGYIGVSVQGYGLQRYFSVSKTPKDNYFNPEYNERGKERIFLSTKDVDGFPPATNVMEKWLKKYEHK